MKKLNNKKPKIPSAATKLPEKTSKGKLTIKSVRVEKPVKISLKRKEIEKEIKTNFPVPKPSNKVKVSKNKQTAEIKKLKKQTENIDEIYNEILNAKVDPVFIPASEATPKSNNLLGNSVSLEGVSLEENGKLPPKKRNGQQALTVDNLNETETMFTSELSIIRAMLSKDEATGTMVSETTISSIHRSMLKTSLDLVPIAEEVYRQYKNERSCYAYSALINQVRELINDLRNSQNLEGQLQYILVNIIQPSMTLIVRQLAHEVYMYREKVKTTINDDKNLKKSNVAEILVPDIENIVREYAKYLHEVYGKMEADLRKYLISS